MRRRVDTAEELKRLEGSFLPRNTFIEVTDEWWERGLLKSRVRKVVVPVIDFEGVTVEYRLLLKLFKTFKQTRVRSVTVEAVPDGLHILFDRAFYFLKGIEDG